MDGPDQTNAPADADDAADEASQPTDREICLTHSIKASPDVIYTMWTDPHHLPNWFGPEGFTATVQEIDVRVGGHWRFTMRGPHGKEMPNVIDYVELVKPERLVYVHRDGAGEAAWQFHVTVTLTRNDGGTELRLHMLYDDVETRDRMVGAGIVEAGNSTLRRLDDYVASMQTQPAPTS
jgi:uncharacterized protein YndB with AHSA1/START domain